MPGWGHLGPPWLAATVLHRIRPPAPNLAPGLSLYATFMETDLPGLPDQPLAIAIACPQAAVEALRAQLLALLDDCDGFDCERLRWRLHTAECAADLWLLREPIHQALVRQHCLPEAARRLDGLKPAFRRALPESLVSLG